MKQEDNIEESNGLDYLAHFFSFVFHPLLMPTYIFLMGSVGLQGFVYQQEGDWWRLLQFIFIVTFAMPALVILLMRRMNWIKSITLELRDDRPLPMFLTAIIYAFSIYLIQGSFLLNLDMLIILATITLTILFTAMVSLFVKISAHAIGTAGGLTFIGILAYKYPENHLLIYAVLASLAWGSTLFARLQLRAHTQSQIWSGSIFAVLLSISLFNFIGLWVNGFSLD